MPYQKNAINKLYHKGFGISRKRKNCPHLMQTTPPHHPHLAFSNKLILCPLYLLLMLILQSNHISNRIKRSKAKSFQQKSTCNFLHNLHHYYFKLSIVIFSLFSFAIIKISKSIRYWQPQNHSRIKPISFNPLHIVSVFSNRCFFLQPFL